MDELATRRRETGTDDLASIVLGSVAERGADRDATGARPRVRGTLGPERVPVGGGDRPDGGHDARSVAVLALVVALIAALGGWLTSIGGDEPPTAATARDAQAGQAAQQGSAGDADVDATPAPTGDATEVPSTAGAGAIRGIDLAVGRLMGSRSESGIGQVAVGITNAGSQPYAGRAGASMLVLLDGDVVATEQVPPLAPGASTRLTVPLGWCPAGSMPVTAILDVGATVREGDERNNATTRSVAFGC